MAKAQSGDGSFLKLSHLRACHAQLAPLAEAVPPKLYGGSERVVSWLTEELVDMGHEVTLFASGDSTTNAALVACSSRSLRLDPAIRISYLPYSAMLARLAELASRFDLVHSHLDWVHIPLLGQLSVPFVTTLHGRIDLPELDSCFDRCFADYPLQLPAARGCGGLACRLFGAARHRHADDHTRHDLQNGRRMHAAGQIDRGGRRFRPVGTRRLQTKLDGWRDVGAALTPIRLKGRRPRAAEGSAGLPRSGGQGIPGLPAPDRRPGLCRPGDPLPGRRPSPCYPRSRRRAGVRRNAAPAPRRGRGEREDDLAQRSLGKAVAVQHLRSAAPASAAALAVVDAISLA
jgi:hypothetical protein